LLSDSDESNAKFACDSGPENEPTRLDGCNSRDAVVAKRISKGGYETREYLGVVEQPPHVGVTVHPAKPAD
jgi:hypothetical protein